MVLDFDGIKGISPAFADEIFRVFTTAHPHIVITPINVNEDVGRMISKAKADAQDT